jgi:RND family efflux transporter MFP subunit
VSLVALVGMVALSGGAALAGCGGSQAAQPGRPAGPPPLPVQIEKVRSVPLRDSSEYVATLRSRRSVQVQPQVAGYVTAIYVSSGDRVRARQALMQIDPSRQRATVNSQQAIRVASSASLDYWRQQYRRVARLYKGGAASRQDLDQARTSLQQAEANTASSGAQVRAESVQLRYYRVSALWAGTVGDIPVRVGDYVTPSTLLTTLDQNDVLEAYVEIPLERASSLRRGTAIELVDGAGQRLAGSQVSFISPRADADTQAVLVKARFPNPEGRLRTAQFIRARLIWSERQGPVVPVLAVQNRNGQAFAWVVKPAPDGALTVEQRAVQVGPIEGQSYPVLRGLAGGESIVAGGVQKLRPGARVVGAAGGGAADGHPDGSDGGARGDGGERDGAGGGG